MNDGYRILTWPVIHALRDRYQDREDIGLLDLIVAELADYEPRPNTDMDKKEDSE